MPVLEEVVRLMTAAERQADLVADLCHRGEPVDNELGGLTAAVVAVLDRLEAGVPDALQPRWASLTERVATATRAADARRQVLAVDLEVHARQDRVRRAYVRPPT